VVFRISQVASSPLAALRGSVEVDGRQAYRIRKAVSSAYTPKLGRKWEAVVNPVREPVRFEAKF
jgi:hypothetical protein